MVNDNETTGACGIMSKILHGIKVASHKRHINFKGYKKCKHIGKSHRNEIMTFYQHGRSIFNRILPHVCHSAGSVKDSVSLL